MSSIAPKDVVALVTSILSLVVGILSLIVAYRALVNVQRRRQDERFVWTLTAHHASTDGRQ